MPTTRREFLIDGLQVAGSLTALGLLRGAGAERGGEGILVVLQLTGGNDGLNTVVPHRQDPYYRLRPTLALAPAGLHRLDDDTGLHPRMEALARLYDEGKLAIVQGVGVPDPDRSHFRSMEIWHTADPEGPRRGRTSETGWLGRLCDRFRKPGRAALGGAHVGSSDLPLILRGERGVPPAFADARGLVDGGEPPYTRWRERVLERVPGPGPLAQLFDVARESYELADRLEEVLADRPRVDYPDTPLAQRLGLVAALIQAGFGLRVFHLEHGGFDTHARQAATQAELLGTLSEALAAFQRDLHARRLAPRVATFVFSEFGRRAAENGSRGTDHGAALPCFVLGERVRGGLHGQPPDLEALVDGDVPPAVDFRSLYAALERSVLGVAPTVPLDPFPGLFEA